MSKNKYDILDKILAESDKKGRGGGSGNDVWVTDDRHPQGGYWITSDSDWQTLDKSVSDIEKYLRS